MWRVRNSNSKYYATSTRYNGRLYHSKFEANYAKELDLRVKAHDIKGWEPQVKIPLLVNNKKVATYYIDFKITHNDDSIEYIEVKGFATQLWMLKWKIFEALYGDLPNVILTVVK